MTPLAYYNEVDPYAAQWLRNLIDAGHIAPGHVDERDIRDVRPSDLDGYTQCHFFAGVGIWSAALRVAGWPDDKPVWTGSCPCQPFSAAGAGVGFDDERHLWPHWHWLIQQCRPEIVFGEQVASKDGLGWADLVSSDMEATGYAFGAVDTCAAGFGSFHIRQRLYFAAEDQRLTEREAWRDVVRRYGGVGQSERTGLEGHGATSGPSGWDQEARPGFETGTPCGVGNTGSTTSKRDTGEVSGTQTGSDSAGRPDGRQRDGRSDASDASRMADPNGRNASPEREQRSGQQRLQQGGRRGIERMADITSRGRGERGNAPRTGQGGHADSGCDTSGQPWHIRDRDTLLPDPANGYWRNADWLYCRDGKWRPVMPESFPLAHGAASRVGRLRAYGNGLDLSQAAGFIDAYMTRHKAEKMAENLLELMV